MSTLNCRVIINFYGPPGRLSVSISNHGCLFQESRLQYLPLSPFLSEGKIFSSSARKKGINRIVSRQTKEPLRGEWVTNTAGTVIKIENPIFPKQEHHGGLWSL